MDILNPRSLRDAASRALSRGRDPKKLVFSYAAIVFAVSLVMILGNIFLDHQISGTGGLGNLGTRAVFSTVQQLLPMVSALVAMCLEFGYLSGMMRIARGQYADHTDLKVGFQKFWPLLRLMLLLGMLLFFAGLLAFQAGSLIFAMTPWAEPVLELTTKISTMAPSAIDEQTVAQLMQMSIPMFVIVGIAYLFVLIPLIYRIRMAMFCLLDDPNGRAMAAIAASNRMMRRKFGAMLKIDLSLWLYYIAGVFVYVLMYSDLILALLGISVPLDPQIFSLLVYVAALALQFVIHITLRNKAEAVYLTAYDRLREKPKEGGPVTLGNIFDM